MAEYVKMNGPGGSGEERRGASRRIGVGDDVLLNSARWFIRIRWMVVAASILIGVCAYLLKDFFDIYGIIPPCKLPWVMAFVLALANTVFFALLSRFKRGASRLSIKSHIWLQIMMDLTLVSVIVHFVGSIETPIAFIYLFHIVLACIFFSPQESLMVTAVAGIMYALCVFLEATGNVSHRGVFVSKHVYPWDNDIIVALYALSALGVWVIVWYFVSTLSKALRNRDKQLTVANEQLVQADVEKNKLVLRTTHDLKAPFSGMESNIQLLLLRHGDDLPDEAKVIIEKIEVKARMLRERIRQVLTLGNLRSDEQDLVVPGCCRLREVVDAAMENIRESAESRSVSIDVNIDNLEVKGDKERLVEMFSNLLSNAVFYSHEDGAVEIVSEEVGRRVGVSVVDHGIGIKKELLPKIFDEYFRSPAAAKHNQQSTGLGLAIVSEIVASLCLEIKVRSEPEKGTTFEVWLPMADKTAK